MHKDAERAKALRKKVKGMKLYTLRDSALAAAMEHGFPEKPLTEMSNEEVREWLESLPATSEASNDDTR